MSPERLSTAGLRRKNRNRVYRLLYDNEAPLTKQELSNRLALSLPTITQNLRELSEAGLIEYTGTVDSTGGRKARLIAPIADARFAVGIELSPQHIRFVAVNLRVEEIAFQRISCLFSNDLAYRMQLSHQLEAFLDAFSLDRSQLLGVGISLPGIVSEQDGMIEIAPVLRVRKLGLSTLTGQIPYPAFVQNDASAGGFAEWWNRSNLSSMAYVFLGQGVGGAILLDGKLYVGANRRSGEFGHSCIVPGGRQCSCGRLGCLEAYCSTDRLTLDLNLTLEAFFSLLHDKDEQAWAVWRSYLDHLAIGIHNIRTMLDCDIVLGGTLPVFLEPYLPDLRTRLARLSSFGDDGNYVHLGRCRSKANCIGVALHFISRFLDTI